MAGIKIIFNNKQARFNYQIEDTLEVGIVLTGSEVKSLRNGAVQLKDSYVIVQRGELFLIKSHISPYKDSSYNNHEPERKRKLLAHAHEIERLEHKITAAGMSLVATKIYFKKGIIKLELGLGKGKNLHDKRQSLKQKDAKREIARSLKNY
ncbi:MAG: SsrA-binding protein SmpB [Bdellovibrionales bacterium]